MRLKLILIAMISLNVPAFALADSSTSTVANNVQTVLKTCQCPKCDLSGADLSNFQPGNGAAIKQYAFGKNYDAISNGKASVFSDYCLFSQANFSHANLSNTNFTTMDTSTDTVLYKVDFTGANFSHANLSNSQFGIVTFASANFSHANLNNTTIVNSDFTSANFSYASLVSTVSQPINAMNDFGSIFASANFSYADLSNANLDGNFINTNFSHAKFHNTILATSGDDYSLTTGNDTGVLADYYKGTNFSYTDLRGVSFQSAGQATSVDLSKAILCHTIMPDSSVSNRNCGQSQ